METPHFTNPAGFMIHSAVHEAREDALGVYHTHTLHGVVVSAQKHGLLPISPSSLFPLTSIGYHDYEGLALSAEEKPQLVADLGRNQALILRNYGLLTVEHSTAEALLTMYVLEATCRIQIMAQPGGSELIPIAKPILQSIRAQVDQVREGLGSNLVWPALLRKLDRIDPSYKQ
jgi:ribulose-5-phosphate 4-epimerase/fuculose-1-phosphate aldolase